LYAPHQTGAVDAAAEVSRLGLLFFLFFFSSHIFSTGTILFRREESLARARPTPNSSRARVNRTATAHAFKTSFTTTVRDGAKTVENETKLVRFEKITNTVDVFKNTSLYFIMTLCIIIIIFTCSVFAFSDNNYVKRKLRQPNGTGGLEENLLFDVIYDIVFHAAFRVIPRLDRLPGQNPNFHGFRFSLHWHQSSVGQLELRVPVVALIQHTAKESKKTSSIISGTHYNYHNNISCGVDFLLLFNVYFSTIIIVGRKKMSFHIFRF
jgi:hypothetical protein